MKAWWRRILIIELIIGCGLTAGCTVREDEPEIQSQGEQEIDDSGAQVQGKQGIVDSGAQVQGEQKIELPFIVPMQASLSRELAYQSEVPMTMLQEEETEVTYMEPVDAMLSPEEFMEWMGLADQDYSYRIKDRYNEDGYLEYRDVYGSYVDDFLDRYLQDKKMYTYHYVYDGDRVVSKNYDHDSSQFGTMLQYRYYEYDEYGRLIYEMTHPSANYCRYYIYKDLDDEDVSDQEDYQSDTPRYIIWYDYGAPGVEHQVRIREQGQEAVPYDIHNSNIPYLEPELIKQAAAEMELAEDEELECYEWIDEEKTCLRARIQFTEQPENAYRHKADYFFFLTEDQTIRDSLYVDYAHSELGFKDNSPEMLRRDRYAADACSFDAHFEDVTFDGQEDLMISLGYQGVHGIPVYCAYIYQNGRYIYEQSFEDIPDYTVDAEHQRIIGYCNSGADSYTEPEYEYRNGEFVKVGETDYVWSPELQEYIVR